MFFGNTRPGPSASSPITPIASSIVIKSVADLQTQIGDELDSFVKDHPVPGPKTAASPELVAAWRTFPRSRPWYSKHIKRLADISASVNAEQAVAELILQWLPPAFGSAQPGQAFMRSQFVFAKFTQRLGCLSVSTAASGNQKELAAKQQEETRNMEVVQTVVCITVCDVLAALLEPRAGRGSPIDPDLGHICVQLAFAQFNPQNDRTRMLEQTMHASRACMRTRSHSVPSPLDDSVLPWLLPLLTPMNASPLDPRGSGRRLQGTNSRVVGRGRLSPRPDSFRPDSQ